jgi:hypothetical protein
MKLRLQANSVRLRLIPSEIQRLREIGLVEESVDFGTGGVLAYRLHCGPKPGLVDATFGQGIVSVSVSKDTAQARADSEEVGLYARSGVLRISVEKNFRCLTRRLDEQEREAYPHPGKMSETRS